MNIFPLSTSSFFYLLANEPSHFFIPQCENKTRIGYNCNISNAPCDMFDPCLNNGTCYNVDTLPLGYQCVCPNESYGINCELSYRPCASNPCWNNGTPILTLFLSKLTIKRFFFFVGTCKDLNETFVCRCEYGWEGSHCQTKENFCKNVTCQNRGVCRPLFRDFKCECLDINYYSGRFCEITTKKIIILKSVSKSISFIAIIVMVSAAMFIIIMDILKYCFGIDPVRKERERIRQKQKAKKRKPVIQRFVYVNAPPKDRNPIVEETAV